jgi:hypothetical protein
MSNLLAYLSGHKLPIKVDIELNQDLLDFEPSQQAKMLTMSGVTITDKLNNRVYYPGNRVRKVKIIMSKNKTATSTLSSVNNE